MRKEIEMSYINEKLNEFNNFAKGKKIAIIGLGVSNLPLLDYFYNLGSQIAVFDSKKIDELDENIVKKINDYSIQYFGGEDNLKNLVGYNIIFRSPSVMPYRPEIKAEIERGAIVTTEIEMVLKLTPSKVIGVTGTEGKTTTTTIIYEIIKNAGYKCFLGGNIGKPIFTEIKDMRPEDIIILEMSSFQLTSMDVSPDISVVTNIFPDHLNVHSSYEEYREEKKNIFKHQNENGIVVLNYDNEFTREFSKEANGKTIFFSSKEKLEDGFIYDNTDGIIKYCEDGVRRHLLKKEDVKLRGIHNYENICSALAATSSLVSLDSAIKTIKEFKGVEHRLEFVRELNGVKWYNDSIGTSPASTIAGLNAFDENIVLIAGGSDKGLDYKEVGETIAKKVGTLILTGPTATKIEEATRKAINGDKVEICYVENLRRCSKIGK
jgi:UDP-N-acetylmuramoylalanine--D-glutamate ligase